jgi:pimeloyl-ACP methyl ester carboxylesterase
MSDGSACAFQGECGRWRRAPMRRSGVTQRIANVTNTITYRKIDDRPAPFLHYLWHASYIQRGPVSALGDCQMPAALSAETFAAFGGVNLVGDVGGDSQGTPIILIHGGGQTRHSWGSAALELAAKGYYVVALDLRGHGDSDWAPDAEYGIDAQIRDLRAVVRRMPAPPVLIGASMGGLIALTTAGEAQQPAVRALVLVDVTPQVDPEGRARIIGFMRDRPEGFASVEEAADAIAAYLPHRPRPKDLSGLHRNLRKRANGRWYWHWDPRLFDTFETDPAAAVLRYSAAAKNIKIPTLLVRGSKSELVTPQSVAHLRELIPQAEYVDVKDAAHMIAGDRNDAFNAVVLEFLGRRVPVRT